MIDGAWFRSVPADELFRSELALGEIRRGVERLRRRDAAQAEVFEGWLEGLRSRVGDRIVPIDAEIAEEWGRMGAVDPLPVEDTLMAATAKVRGMVFVTRNVADAERTARASSIRGSGKGDSAAVVGEAAQRQSGSADIS